MESDIAYKKLVKHIADQLYTMHDLMGRHGKRQEQNPRDWGFVGDLNTVSDYLLNAIAYLSQTEKK
jgi:hypothetical protein